MDIKILDNTKGITEAFISSFVMSWDDKKPAADLAAAI